MSGHPEIRERIENARLDAGSAGGQDAVPDASGDSAAPSYASPDSFSARWRTAPKAGKSPRNFSGGRGISKVVARVKTQLRRYRLYGNSAPKQEGLKGFVI